MKNKIIVIASLILFLFASQESKAQSGNSQANLFAHKIANKMKDSLGLSEQQRNQIFQVNMELHDQKQLVRQNVITRDSVAVRIQRIENMRDDLYKKIIGNEKYKLYLKKKRNLINNN